MPTAPSINSFLTKFAKRAGQKLASELGEPEDQIRGPLEALVAVVSEELGLPAHLVGEARLAEDRVRPDYAALRLDNPLPVGFIELKAPGTGADASRFRGRNKTQWERLSALPNVIYTDANDWVLYRTGEPVRRATLVGDVRDSELADPDGSLTVLLTDFLNWEPEAPRNARQLVSAVAGLCRLLRDEVLELTGESEALGALAADWRHLLFPDATDDEFADGYAQAVTFALLLARAEGIDFSGRTINDIAARLGKHHSLMGKALSVLTDESLVGQLSTSVNTLLRVSAVVDWSRLRYHGREPWLRFYEDFLEVYDPQLRKRTGSYYTPNEVVASMVRLVDELLRSRLGQNEGFASANVVAVDPAMGTGTFLLHIIELIAERVSGEEGEGAVAPRLRDGVGRLIGFERQLGPYAVAELRAFEEYYARGVALPSRDLRLYVADTLDNPYVEETRLAAGYEPIARSRRAANKVKRDETVMVVIGNPPYKDYAKNHGGWVERGDVGTGRAPLLADFMPPKEWSVSGTVVRHLYNLYVYFWRWGLWKVFEAHAENPNGVVAFITSAGFLRGDGFVAMRQHIRSIADEVWVIDLTPEGHQPEVSTRVFPKVQQPLCIAIALRDGSTGPETPAPVHYRAVTGKRSDKFNQLASQTFDDGTWRTCADGWTDPFVPSGSSAWQGFPALVDLLPWSSPGVGANRSWPIATSPEVLVARWQRLVATHNPVERARLLKETRDRKLRKEVAPLPGLDAHRTVLGDETSGPATPVRYGWRSFHRSWVIPDSRVLDMPRPELWAALSDRQVFAAEQHTEALENGPAVTFTSYVPDLHYFNGRGGRAFPLYRDAAATVLNVAPGLLRLLAEHGLRPVGEDDVFAYIGAVAAHSGFTLRFREELASPGVRVPVTVDPGLWAEAVEIGREVVWLHTFGERFASRTHGRPRSPARLSEHERPKVLVAIPDTEAGMPDDFEYDEASETLRVGEGRIAPVPLGVWSYEVSTYRVLQRWLRRRLRRPEGKRSSPLDDVVASRWSPETTTELLDLLNVLGRVVLLEPRQDDLLRRIVDGPMLTVTELQDAGVFPVAAAARRSLRTDAAGPGLFG